VLDERAGHALLSVQMHSIDWGSGAACVTSGSRRRPNMKGIHKEASS